MNIDPDRVFANYLGIKIKCLILVSHLIILYWLIFYEFNISVLFIGYIFWIALGKVGGDIGYHRLFSHKSFKTSQLKKRFLLVLGTLIGIGSSISWVSVHRSHHRYADTIQDPHSPVQLGILRTWFTFWNSSWSTSVSSVKDIIKDKDHLFFHKNYFKIIMLHIAILLVVSYLFSYPLLLIVFAIPNFLTFHGAGLVDAICHRYGYKNYNTNDNSKNNFYVNLAMFGAGLHNNHHAFPSSYSFDVASKKFEFDLMAVIIKYFFLEKNENR